ncbi:MULTISPECIES: tripartite tricarboxylate transporter substrate binding protein [unclassified Variovorax]|jgi:tripartite-type tricarboxylate transporter receptor subunit TctC|uniref:Bug family tripartite tricarboxylate transporter substrate binding protein n=1 Tax=unclassified Variovorax TaxID=663243 RepID=UPI00199D7F1A|nr:MULTISPECIES: tripartite tricarboxylate transporter substrate binding protein [unclassified Variovorax]MBC7391780.1 tripartite tricarboxylate transporter substrate binding protein [Variovorax sp.]MEB0058398.1 tripartite tricarboxylate transporter substrate binding protein [Variovorax sp. LG9.2]MEB0111832.1 tripartite tricarboxylate transporter substrate binding protein [Variovorax sp. RTB1]
MQRNHFLRASLAMAGVFTFGGAWAQTYPTKPIRLVVPFPAGGATDLFARTLSQKMGEKLGATLVVENRPGAGGAIGSDIASKATPDGYTLLLATTSTHSIGPAMTVKLPYDTVRDFTPIAHVGDAPSVMLVPNDAPAKTVREWIDYAKKNPGKLNYASSGNGTIVQLTAELFKSQAGIFVTHIPYKGTALAIPDLISGKIDVLFDSLPTGMPHVRDGRLRALGVTTLKRSPLAPDLQPIAEVLPGFESNTWFGLYGPKALPANLVTRINTAANEALADPEVRAKLSRLGIEPTTSTPQELASMVAADAAKWKKIITDRNIKND